jgi:hypothetical protein
MTTIYRESSQEVVRFDTMRRHRNIIPFEIFMVSLFLGILSKSLLFFVIMLFVMHLLVSVKEIGKAFIATFSLFWGALFFAAGFHGGAWGSAIMWGLIGFIGSFSLHQSSLECFQGVPLQLSDLFGVFNRRQTRQTRIPESVKQSVLKRDGEECSRCRCPINLSFVHILPLAKGGSNSASNVQILCSECKHEKGEVVTA